MGKNKIAIRAAASDDLMAITRIYNHYVVDTHYTFDLDPQKVDQQRVWFGQFAEDGPYRLLVATAGDDVIGYVYSSQLRQKPAYDSSIETTIYLDDKNTGSGTGVKLYKKLFDALADQPLHRAYAGIALPNKASIALHERVGFKRIGVFAEVGWKFGRYWDVAWYERRL